MQGFLENSNVDPTREMIDLIRTQRAFEFNSQVVRAADDAPLGRPASPLILRPFEQRPARCLRLVCRWFLRSHELPAIYRDLAQFRTPIRSCSAHRSGPTAIRRCCSGKLRTGGSGRGGPGRVVVLEASKLGNVRPIVTLSIEEVRSVISSRPRRNRAESPSTATPAP